MAIMAVDEIKKCHTVTIFIIITDLFSNFIERNAV